MAIVGSRNTLLPAEQSPYPVLQDLKELRAKAEAASAAVVAATKAVAQLEVAIPKARMEATAQRAKAADLQTRLAELQAATQVGFPCNVCSRICSSCPPPVTNGPTHGLRLSALTSCRPADLPATRSADHCAVIP